MKYHLGFQYYQSSNNEPTTIKLPKYSIFYLILPYAKRIKTDCLKRLSNIVNCQILPIRNEFSNCKGMVGGEHGEHGKHGEQSALAYDFNCNQFSFSRLC